MHKRKYGRPMSPDERKGRCVRLYEMGQTQEWIARETGVTRPLVTQYLGAERVEAAIVNINNGPAPKLTIPQAAALGKLVPNPDDHRRTPTGPTLFQTPTVKEQRQEAARSHLPTIAQAAADHHLPPATVSALTYAIARQRDRRNLSRQEFNSYVAHVVRASDRIKAPIRNGGGQFTVASPDATGGKSAADLADKIGVSAPTVERVRAVLASDEDAVKAQLLAGEIAPKAAYIQVKRTEAARPCLPAGRETGVRDGVMVCSKFGADHRESRPRS